MPTADRELLRAALIGYERQLEIIAERIAEVTQELGGRPGRRAAERRSAPRRAFSAETRRRMAEAQRRRWAGVKRSGPKPKKRHLSAEARRNIAEATRRRWAAYRAAKAGRKK